MKYLKCQTWNYKMANRYLELLDSSLANFREEFCKDILDALHEENEQFREENKQLYDYISRLEEENEQFRVEINNLQKRM